jgi:uncharacterized protein YjbI with pentapeptide repeats
VLLGLDRPECNCQAGPYHRNVVIGSPAGAERKPRGARKLPLVKERWSGSNGQALAREVITRLLTGDKLDDLHLGRYRGRTDLRGLWLVSSRGLPGPRLAGQLEGVPAADGVTWSGLDLSSSTFRIDLQGSTVVNTALDRVGWQGWVVSRSVLQDCSFTSADLRDASFDHGNGYLPSDPVRQQPAEYLRCAFTRTRTGPYASWGRAIFDHCEFSSTQFTSPQWFHGAELIGCRFRGEFRDVIFGWAKPGHEPAPRVEAVDVREATFTAVSLLVHRGSGLLAGQRR